jgi:hypothetical protein
MSRRIEVHIEELVLHGVDARDRHRVADAMQQELLRMFAGAPLPPGLERPAARPRVDGGSFAAPAGRDVRALGEGIARAVHGGIVR